MTSACPESTPDQLCSPRLPPELFLEVFSHADRSTLAALCSTSLAFLELATPFLYETAHSPSVSCVAESPQSIPFPLAVVALFASCLEFFPRLRLEHLYRRRPPGPHHLSGRANVHYESGGLPPNERCVSDFSPLEGLAAHFAFLPSSRRPASPKMYSTYVTLDRSVDDRDAVFGVVRHSFLPAPLYVSTSRRLSLSSMFYLLFLIQLVTSPGRLRLPHGLRYGTLPSWLPLPHGPRYRDLFGHPRSSRRRALSHGHSRSSLQSVSISVDRSASKIANRLLALSLAFQTPSSWSSSPSSAVSQSTSPTFPYVGASGCTASILSRGTSPVSSRPSFTGCLAVASSRSSRYVQTVSLRSRSRSSRAD
jgi:hypothetical protein